MFVICNKNRREDVIQFRQKTIKQIDNIRTTQAKRVRNC